MVQVAKQLAWYHQPDSDPSLAPTHSTLKVFQWGRRELQNPKKPTGDLPFLSGRCCQRQQCFNLSQTTAHTESSWRGRRGALHFYDIYWPPNSYYVSNQQTELFLLLAHQLQSISWTSIMFCVIERTSSSYTIYHKWGPESKYSSQVGKWG